MSTPREPARTSAAYDEAVGHGVTPDGAAAAPDGALKDESGPAEDGGRKPAGAAHLLSLLTGYVTHMTDEEAQAVLPDMLRDVEVVFRPAQDPGVPPTADAFDASEESAATRPPEHAVSDEFNQCPTCGDAHTEVNYELGCTYATNMADALTAALEGDCDRARHRVTVADRALWPLADVNDPDSLRDFIAATHTRFEFHLRALGANVPA